MAAARPLPPARAQLAGSACRWMSSAHQSRCSRVFEPLCSPYPRASMLGAPLSRGLDPQANSCGSLHAVPQLIQACPLSKKVACSHVLQACIDAQCPVRMYHILSHHGASSVWLQLPTGGGTSCRPRVAHHMPMQLALANMHANRLLLRNLPIALQPPLQSHHTMHPTHMQAGEDAQIRCSAWLAPPPA